MSIGLFVNTAFGVAPPPPTNFVVTISDESNNKLEIPSILQIEEILNAEVLASYQIDVFDNPQTISIDWYAPSRDVNTEIHIVAIKQGYQKSQEFIFTITSNTPTEGKLFEHTFVLNTKETSKITEKDYQVTKIGKSHTVGTSSSSNIQSVNFIENENTLLIIVNEDSVSGSTSLNIPTTLISTPLQVFLDDTTIILSEEKSDSEINLDIEYPNGVHSIRVVSTIDTDTSQNEQGIKSEFEEQIEQPELVPVPSPSSGGGCLIATATYGSELAPEVQKLRELRDNSLLSTESGTNFMNSFNDVYYTFSPVIADYERENPVFKEMVKVAITPMITSLSILHYVDMDSEESVLGYGISLIMLNVVMYIGIPILAVMKFRK